MELKIVPFRIYPVLLLFAMTFWGCSGGGGGSTTPTATTTITSSNLAGSVGISYPLLDPVWTVCWNSDSNGKPLLFVVADDGPFPLNCTYEVKGGSIVKTGSLSLKQEDATTSWEDGFFTFTRTVYITGLPANSTSFYTIQVDCCDALKKCAEPAPLFSNNITGPYQECPEKY